jgi:hypothetical protein
MMSLLCLALGATAMTQTTIDVHIAAENFVSYEEHVTEFEQLGVTVSQKMRLYGGSSFSEPGMPMRAIGLYELALDPKDPDIVALSQSIPGLKAAFAARPPWVPSMGGMRPSKTFWIGQSPTDGVFNLDNDAALAPGEQRFQDVIDRLIERVSHHPLVAIFMTARLGATEAKRGDKVTVTFTFTNPGKLAAVIPSPALAGKPPWNEFRLTFWKPGLDDDGDPGWEVETFVDLRGEMLLAEHKTLKPDPMFISIEPGASLTVSTEFRVPRVKPSVYQVQAFFITKRRGDSPPGRDREIYGQFHTDPVQLLVKRFGATR